MKVHYPFYPKIRLDGESVSAELFKEIIKISEQFKIPVSELEASFQLLPDPQSPDQHYFLAQVTHVPSGSTPMENQESVST